MALNGPIDTHHPAIPWPPPTLTEVEWFAFVAARLALQEVVEAYRAEARHRIPEEDTPC
jgi:hypothetical protein